MANVIMTEETRSYPELWDKEWVEEHIQYMSQKEIAEYLGCLTETVRSALRRWNLSRPLQTKFPQLRQSEWLKEQVKTRIVSDIANEVGCSPAAVNYALKFYGISLPKRDKRRHPLPSLGERFGKMVVVGFSRGSQGHTLVEMACDCGGNKTINPWKLRKQEYGWDHCGCLDDQRRRDSQRTHGATAQGAPPGVRRAYSSWAAMWKRCQEDDPQAQYYIEDGIDVCEQWKDFEVFLADMGERPEHTTLDRLNPEAGYFPSNCQWGSPVDQSRNKHKQIGLMEVDWQYVVMLLQAKGTEQAQKIVRRIQSRMDRWASSTLSDALG